MIKLRAERNEGIAVGDSNSREKRFLLMIIKKELNISVECLRRLTYLQSNLIKPTNCKGARNILAGRIKADERRTFSSLKSHREITKFVKTIVVKPSSKENCAQRIYVTT